MDWFEKRTIRNRETLTVQQIEYLQRPSLAIRGAFNGLARRHWDYLISTWFLLIAIYVIERLQISFILQILASLIGFIMLFLVYYFFTKHSRRLAWNRREWPNFETFEDSETTWSYFASVCLLFQMIYFIISLIQEPLGGTIIFISHIFPVGIPFIVHRIKMRKARQKPLTVTA